MEKLQVWLDDEREEPGVYDVWVKNAYDAIELIKTNTVEFISLDYYMGENSAGCLNGLDVAEFIRDEYKAGNIDFVKFHPHTSNPYMFEKILKVKREHLANHKQKLENNA